MSQQINLKIAGLYTHPNELSEVPEGALLQAQDIVIDEESIAQPRRGYEQFNDLGGTLNKLFAYKGELIGHYGTDSLAYESGATFTDYTGTFTPIDSSTRVRSAQANQNFYFTTSSGVKKLDEVATTPVDSGAPKAISMSASLVGASGFLEVGDVVAYRLVWGYEDANKNLILGAPSQRLVVENTDPGTRNVDIQVDIPDDITTDFFFQIYRTQPVTAPSDPGEEMGIIVEEFPTAGEITAESLTFSDETPVGLEGATLYTAPSQEGLLQANEQPPRAKDIATLKGFTWYANTISKHRVIYTLLAADGGGAPGTALQVDDVITIDGIDYTGKAATNVANAEFAVSTAATPAQRIDETARELVKVINQHVPNTSIDAYYLSGENDLPGRMLLEKRPLGSSSFTVSFTPVVVGANPFAPVLPITSTNDEYKNGLYFSKLNQPEAVPLTNLLFVGSAQEEILRIVPLRDSLFIFKTDGIFRLVGSSPENFSVDLFDDTAQLIGPETAVTVANQIMMFSDQGIVAVTETGVRTMSRPIERDLLDLLGLDRDSMETNSFAISYESDRKYIFYTIKNAGGTQAEQAFVYNTFTNTWTKWDLTARHGLVNPVDDKVHYGKEASDFLRRERKDFSSTDIADYVKDVEILAISADELTLTLDNVDDIERGDLIWQTENIYSSVASVDTDNLQVTMSWVGEFTTGAGREHLAAINGIVEWVPYTGANPGVLKHFREASILFKRQPILETSLSFGTDISSAKERVTITATPSVAWGFFPWGSEAWGGLASRRSYRTYVPREKQICSQMNAVFQSKVAYSEWKLEGLSIIFEVMSERISK